MLLDILNADRKMCTDVAEVTKPKSTDTEFLVWLTCGGLRVGDKSRYNRLN